jgi:apolipoprotein N-acyltransferase
MQAVILRAIEQRTSIVRCANTGISTYIDPYGRKFFESPIFKKSSAMKILPIFNRKTFYSRNGDLVGIISGIFMFSFLIFKSLNLMWKILYNSRWIK